MPAGEVPREVQGAGYEGGEARRSRRFLPGTVGTDAGRSVHATRLRLRGRPEASPAHLDASPGLRDALRKNGRNRGIPLQVSGFHHGGDVTADAIARDFSRHAIERGEPRLITRCGLDFDQRRRSAMHPDRDPVAPHGRNPTGPAPDRPMICSGRRRRSRCLARSAASEGPSWVTRNPDLPESRR